jgi:hypothetical protein
MEDFLGKFSCAGVVCHSLLLNSLHICPYSIPCLFFHQRTPFFSYLVPLLLGLPIVGRLLPWCCQAIASVVFPASCVLSTCPSIMSRSSDLFALETWPKKRNFSRRIVTSSDLLGFKSSKTEKFVLFSVQGTRKILLHVHSSKASRRTATLNPCRPSFTAMHSI